MEKTCKDRVAAMRSRGMGYSVIASALGLTKSQMSGYCRRAGIEKGSLIEQDGFCPQCGVAIEKKAGQKPRRFCSDSCRQS